MNRKSGITVIGSILIGFLVGASTTGTAIAEDVPAATVVAQGDFLKVCIDKKSGVIRASAKCNSTEKAYSLGGPGPQGPKGDQGIQGIQGIKGDQGLKGDTGIQGLQGLQGEKGLQGDRGLTGLTGATGTVSGLRTKSIQVWTKGIVNSCSGLFSFNALNADSYLSTFQNSISLNKSCSSLYPENVTVYTP